MPRDTGKWRGEQRVSPLEAKGWTDDVLKKYDVLRRDMTSPGGTEHPKGAKIKPILEKRVMRDAQGNREKEPRPFHQIPDAKRFDTLDQIYQIPDAKRFDTLEQTGTGHVIGWVPTDAPEKDKKRAHEAARIAEYRQRPDVIARRQTDENKKQRAAHKAAYDAEYLRRPDIIARRQKDENKKQKAAYDAAYHREIRAGGTAEEAGAAGWAARHWVNKAWEERQAVAQASPKDVDTRRQQVELQLQQDKNLLKDAKSSPLAAQYLHMQGLTQETLQRRITASETRLDGIAAEQVERQLRQDRERLTDITSSPTTAQYWHMRGLTRETLQQSITASEARLNELMTPPWLRRARETEDGRASS